MISTRRAVVFATLCLVTVVSNGQEMRYQFYQLLLESEVVIDENLTSQDTFDPRIEVQVASFKERVVADFIQHDLSEDFASLALKVKIISSRSYFTVRIFGFNESRTVAHVIDQLVKAGFAPLKIQPLNRRINPYNSTTYEIFCI